MGLGKRINEVRKKKKFSVDELSVLSGVPKGTLSKITAGITTNPTFETVQAIALALNCRLDDLDGIKKVPEQKNPDSEENEYIHLVNELTALFQKYGYIEKDGDISDETLRVMRALVGFLDSYFSSN